MSVQLRGRARTTRRSIVSLFAGLAMLLGLVIAQGANAPTASAESNQAVIGMPFTGKWAYNANVNPPWTDSNSSHPSVHHTPGGGDWGTDLYALGEGDQVRLKVNFPGSNVSFSKISSSTSCGQSLRLNVIVNGVTVGWVYYAHMSNVTSSTSFTNGMVIGTVNSLGCNPGRHIHVEFKNTTGNYSCYVSHGNPGASLAYGANLGLLGAPNAGARQACGGLPSEGSTPTGPVYQNIQHIFTGEQDGDISETYIGTNTSLTTGKYYTAASPIVDTTVRRTSDGVIHQHSATQDGKIYETYWGGGNSLTTWQMADLGQEITKIAVDITTDGVHHIYAGTASGKIYETYVGGGQSLTTYQLANVGSKVTGLGTYRTGDNVNHVFSSTVSGKIYETYWGGGNSLTTWQMADVGEQINELNAFYTSNGVHHVFTGSQSGKLRETYVGGGNSLTTYTLSTISEPIKALIAERTPDSVYHVFVGTASGAVHETYWGGGQSLTAYQLVNVGGSVTSIAFEVTQDGTKHIYTGTAAGHIKDTYVGGGNSLTTWQMASLGSSVNAMAADYT